MPSVSRNDRGFTLIEIIVVLAMVAVLAAVTAPSIIKHVEDSKIQRARQDVESMVASMTDFYKDVGRWPTDNDTNKTLTDQEVRLLQSGTGTTPTQVGGAGWLGLTPVDTFENQLVLNTPAGQASRAYGTTGPKRWNGPYLNEVKDDPWGYRYLCNVRGFHPGQTGAIWMLSAGPNGVIDTAVSDVTVQGDDIGFLLRR